MQVYTAVRMLTNAKRTLAEMAASALTARAATFANVHPDTVDTTAKQTLMIVHPVSFSSMYYQLCHGKVSGGDDLKHLMCATRWCFHRVTIWVPLGPRDYFSVTFNLYFVSPALDPCLNGGSCVDDVGSFSCECHPGFEGEHCEIEADECASQPCRNGAICRDYVNSFVCECRPGFDGILCDHNILECTERWDTELPIFGMHFLKMIKWANSV